MEKIGIGIWEVILVVFITLLVLGPQGTTRAVRGLCRAIRRFFS